MGARPPSSYNNLVGWSAAQAYEVSTLKVYKALLIRVSGWTDVKLSSLHIPSVPLKSLGILDVVLQRERHSSHRYRAISVAIDRFSFSGPQKSN